MRTIDLWFVAFNVWLAAVWHKLGGPTWLAVLVLAFLLGGMIYIKRVRKPKGGV